MSHTKKQETSEEEKKVGGGTRGFLHGGPGRLGPLRVLAGGKLDPRAEEGATPHVLLSEEVTWEQGKVAPP